MDTIFTGGIFEVKDAKFHFYCRNFKAHNKNKETYIIKNKLQDHYLNCEDLKTILDSTFYLRSGAYCSCGNSIKKNYESAVLEPDKIRSLGHLSKMKTPVEEMASYLRYWGYIQITDDDKYININDIPSFDSMNMVEIVDIDEEDAAYPIRKNFIGSRIFIPKITKSKHIKDNIYSVEGCSFKYYDFSFSHSGNKNNIVKGDTTIKDCLFYKFTMKTIGVNLLTL